MQTMKTHRMSSHSPVASAATLGHLSPAPGIAGIFPVNLPECGLFCGCGADAGTVERADAWSEISRVLAAVFCGDARASVSPIPLVCFEGLPGAGKSTQIARVLAACEKKYGKGCLIDPPSGSAVGRMLRSLYADPARWHRMRRENPWLNPLMLSADLRLAVRAAMEQGAGYALVDRGILSTCFYNLNAYAADEDTAWAAMKPHLAAFYRPTVTLFLDVDAEVAHRRVVARRRGELREMDRPERMRADCALLLRCQARLAEIPFCRIDAARAPEAVTEEIMTRLTDFLP